MHILTQSPGSTVPPFHDMMQGDVGTSLSTQNAMHSSRTGTIPHLHNMSTILSYLTGLAVGLYAPRMHGIPSLHTQTLRSVRAGIDAAVVVVPRHLCFPTTS